MRTRIITAVVALACIFPFFWFSAPVETSSPLHYLFPAIIALITLFSIYELLHCVGLDKNYVLAVPLYWAAMTFPILARVISKESFIRLAALCVL